MKAKTKLIKLCGVLLALVMIVGMLPTTAFAAGNPDPTAVFVDGGKSFYNNRLYYKKGDQDKNFTGNEGDYIAHYNPATGTLTLNGYSGGSISVGGVKCSDITVVLKGTNTINGSLENAVGGDITVTSSDGGTLSISKTTSGSNSAIGIETGLSASYTTGNVTIKGNAKVTINMTHNGTSTYEKAYGIFAKENITISENASVDITCATPNNTTGGGNCNGLYAAKDVTIDTNGTIKIDVTNAGKDKDNGYSYGVYYMGTATLTKVGNMEVQWKKEGNSTRYSGGAFIKGATFSDTDHAINVDTTNCYASYRFGTPRKVTAGNGQLTGPGVKYAKNSGYFLAGDKVNIKPNEKKSSDGTLIPFKEWTFSDVMLDKSATTASNSFTVPGKDVTVTATYNPFDGAPVFTRTSDSSGTIAFKTAVKPDNSEFFEYVKDGETTYNGLYPQPTTTSSASPYEYSVSASTYYVGDIKYLEAGDYRMAVTLNGERYLSEKFTVNYTAPVTTYTVSFNANGGTGTMADVTDISGEYTLPANGFTAPDGKYFNGWALSPNGSVLSTEIYNITANTTFYAIWEDIKSVNSIDATITAPVLGKTPDYDPVYTSNPADGVEIVDITWYKIAAEDFTGTDEDSWKTVSSSEEFATGYYYTVDMYFITKEHFAISESTTGTVNGKPHDSTYFNIYVHTYKAYLCAVFEPLNVVTPVTGLKITPASSSSLTLSWDKNDSATGYIIQQYKNGTWTHVRQLARNTVTSYTATGLAPSTTYQYRVRAYYTNGSTTAYSSYTNISGTTKPSNMTGLKATSTSNSVTFSWDKNDSATGYLIQQYKDGAWAHVRQLARNTATTYTATGLAPSTIYQFRIRAYYTNDSSTTYSDYTTFRAMTKPSNMTGLKATSTSNSITFSWDKNDTATGYLIQQYKDGAWAHVRQLARNTATTYTATGLAPSTIYQFRIRAYYTNGSSTTYSDYTTFRAMTKPSNITGVKVSSTSNTVTLSWDKNSTATGYLIQQYKDGKWTHVRQLARNTATTYTATGLTPSTTYQYRIRAYYTSGTATTYSDYTTISIKTTS